jgi:hypothetical protein
MLFLTDRRLVVAFGLLVAAGVAQGQPGGGGPVYVSGLSHTALGGAVLGTPNGRRLPVNNLGSSGQDGVSITLDSMWGGGVSVDVSPLQGTGQARDVRIKYKGWDGTVKGVFRVSSTTDGAMSEGVNYTAIGAVGVEWAALDSSGRVLASGTSSGPILTWSMNIVTTPGRPPVVQVSRAASTGRCGDGMPCRATMSRVSCPDASEVVSGLGSATLGGVCDVVVAPVMCAACPAPAAELSSLEVTCSGVSSLDVLDACLTTFDAECSAAGDPGQILAEECAFSPCTPAERKLVASNIGSSGQDGVECKWKTFRGGGLRLHESCSAMVSSTGAGTPGGGSSAVEARKRCPDCPPGHVTLMKVFDDESPAGRMMHVDCSGVGAPMCDVYCLDASGELVGSARVTAAEMLFVSSPCQGGAAETWTVDSRVMKVEMCAASTVFSSAGTLSASGVTRMVFAPAGFVGPSQLGSCDTLAFLGSNKATLNVQNIKVNRAVTVSGLAHSALGGAVLGTPNGRRLPVNNLGSSGQDGVSIECHTLSGVECDVELAPVFNTAGAELKGELKGESTRLDARIDFVNAGPGSCNVQCDCSHLHAVMMHWTITDNIGGVLAEGDAPSSMVSCTVTDPHMGGSAGMPPSALWNLRGDPTRPTYDVVKSVKCRIAHDVTVTGLTPAPITNAQGLEFRPIMCITEPCPTGWGPIGSLAITASGVPSIEVSNAAMVSFAFAKVTYDYKGQSERDRVGLVGFGSFSIDEFCDNAGGCAAKETKRRVRPSGIGSSGQDGVEINLARSAAGLMVQCDTGPVSPSTGGPAVEYGFKDHQPQGNVTLIKISVYHDPLSNNPTYFADATGRGSSTCRVDCLSGTGAVIASGVVGPSEGVKCTSSLSSGASCQCTCQSGYTMVQIPQGPGTVVLPGVGTVGGVDRLAFTPLNPTIPGGLVDSCTVTVQGCDYADLVQVADFPVVRLDGIACAEVGSALAGPLTADRRLPVHNLGSSGQDGVEVRLDSVSGAVTVDLNALLEPGSTGREIRIRDKGWDGGVKGSLRLSSPPGGGSVTEQLSLISSADGVYTITVTRTGMAPLVFTSTGTAVSWTLTPEGVSSSGNKGKKMSISARSADQGFFDVAMTVSGLGPTPITGVRAIGIKVEPCAGCPPFPPDDGIGSLLVTGTGMPEFVLSAARLHPKLYQESVDPFTAECSAVGLAYLQAQQNFLGGLGAGQQMLARNIGSSGNDGVRVTFFPGQDPPPADAKVKIERPHWTSSSGGDNPSESMEFSRKCPDCPPGHVTLLKCVLEPDASAGARLCTCDATSRGSFTCYVTARDQDRANPRHFVISNTQPIRLPDCAGGDCSFSCDSDGVVTIDLPDGPAACHTIGTPDGAEMTGVWSLEISPISPTVAAGTPDTCNITGVSLDSITFDSVTITLPLACPADLGRQGGLPGGDGHLDNNDFVMFINYFFSGNPLADLGVQGGGPGQDGHFDNNDFVAFIDDFFHGCP